MAIALEKLTSLETAISDVVAELYEIFSAADGLQDYAACKRMLERYMQSVGRIGMLARGAGLDGVHESCFYFYHMLDELKQRNAVLTAEQRDLLEQWPFVITTCLNTPFSVEMVESLLDYFRSEVWPIALPDDVVNDVYDAYRRQTEVAGDVTDTELETVAAGETSLMLVENRPSERAPVSEPPADHRELRGDSQPDAGQQYASQCHDTEIISALQQEVVEATNALFDDLENADNEDAADAITAAFDLCADRLDLMVMSAAEAGMDSLVDVCTLFQANLRALGQRRVALSVEEGQTLAAWPSLVINHLKQPADCGVLEALVDFLQTVPEAAAITDDERARLCQCLVPAQREMVPAAAGMAAQHAACVNTGMLGENVRELVQLVRMELVSAADSFSEALAGFAEADDTSTRAHALNTYTEMVDRFRVATESMGLRGLSHVLDQVYKNVGQLSGQEAVLDEALHALLQRWPELALAYLDSLPDASHSHQLVDYLQDRHWLIAVQQDSAADILHLLRSPEFITEDEDSEPRQTAAEPDDVSLVLPEDINAQLIDSLLQELPGHTAEFSTAISRLADGGGTLQDVDIAQRIAHTLKGSANTVGITGIATLTHHIEDILLAFSKHECLPGGSLASALLAAADVLEIMCESLLGSGPPPEQALPVLQTILDWANRIDCEGIPQQDDNAAEKAVAAPQLENRETAAPVTGIDSGAMLRVPAELVDDLLRLVGESIILTGQLHNRLAQAELQTESVRAQHSLFQQLTAELEHLVETQGLTATHTRDALQEEFDTLELERYNELHTVTHRLVEAATDATELTAGVEDHLATLDELLVDQRKLLKDKQELVMRTRMVQVQTVVPRLQRAVRQAGRQTGKQVNFQVHGAETMIDSQVLADLVDPLTHLLRNAVDHGIEAPAKRAESGKPETGNIEVQVHREGDHIVVACRDDGAGLDLGAIRKTAEARNLVSPDHDLDEQELTRLILLLGFSTRGETTQVSGRGIGMDAVQSRVNELKGTLHIESEAGQGCRVELRLPLTLISVHALLVPANDVSIAVSSRGVDQILYPGAGELERDGETFTFRVEEQVYQAWHLEALLHMPIPADAEQSADRPVLLVRDETSTVRAVCVSQVRATQDLVVKQMGPFVPRLLGIEGTTILGDGSVSPLVDLPVLLGATKHDSTTWISDRPAGAGRSETRPCALVVDDSLSVRRSLAEFMQDLGYEVRTARDGLEAIEVMAEHIPKIILVDLEMPRMNGLELAAHVRAQQTTKDIPMIMITSRSTEKHRKKAQAAGVSVYLTKPFSEDELNDRIQAVLETPEANLA